MRKLMMAAVALAGLGLTAGCQNRNDKVAEERQDVAEAQQDARQETAAAADDFQKQQAEAQKDYQERTAEAQNEVAEERQDVAEAEQERRQDVAEQANENREKVAENQRELDEDRQELNQNQAELNQQESAIGGSGMAAAEQSVTGSLTKASKNELAVRDANGKELKLKLDDNTTLMRNGKAVKADDLKEGAQVRASWTAQGNDKLARQVEVLSNTTVK